MGEFTGVFLFLFGVPALIVLIIAFRRKGPAENITERVTRRDRWN